MQNTVPDINVHIEKIFCDDRKKLKAYASVTIGNHFAIHGIRVFETPSELYVSMPFVPRKHEFGVLQPEDMFHPITTEANRALTEAVIEAYKLALNNRTVTL